MKKIPTLYERSFASGKPCICGKHPIEGLEWVEDGLGIPTEKFDGACCAIIDGVFYKRYDAKNWKPIPNNAIKCQDLRDPVTGHMPCWVPCDRNNPADKHFWKAFENTRNRLGFDLVDGTYEAIGPAWQGNPYGLEDNYMTMHGLQIIDDLGGRDFESIKKYLEDHYIEGIVFWLDGEPRCKIKRTDFGFEWNKRTTKR